jgi:cell division protein ZapA (FtsZ GTPase activity inhibitor)
MTSTTFDTLGYFEKLKAAGFSEEQAKIVANTTREVVDERLVTKEHLDARIRELDAKLRELEYRLQYNLTIRLGAMMAASIAIVAALVRLT